MSARLFLGGETVPWPDTADGDAARRWIAPMLSTASEAWISNVHADVGVVVAGRLCLPISVNDGARESSYVCSPYNHYVTYAAEELRTLGSPLLEAPLGLILRALGALLRWGRIDRAVTVNNWLLSTNLYPADAAELVGPIHEVMLDAFPTHAILYRSVIDDGLLRALERLGYRRIASRQVYLFDPATQHALRPRIRKHLRRDRRALDRSPYQVVGGAALREADVPRLVELYEQLYLGKYSTSNPRFTARFVSHALRDKTLVVRALRRDGRIDGVVGFFVRGRMMTTPFFGYDLEVDRREGLYRLLSAVLVREAETRGLLLHQSSGAAAFKRWRGATARTEYTLVYARHLAARPRLAWAVLAALINAVALPLLRRFEL